MFALCMTSNANLYTWSFASVARWSSQVTSDTSNTQHFLLFSSVVTAICVSVYLQTIIRSLQPHLCILYASLAMLVDAEVEVTLRLTVSQSGRLGVEPTLELVTRYCFL
jgi:hypothetical protein